MASKKRTESRRKETEAINALRNYCDMHGLVFQAEPQEDYGVDCYIEVELDNTPRNFLVGVQSKAGRSYRRELPDGSGFKIDLREKDIQYWLAANYPIILVHFDDVSKEQYFKHIQAEWEGATRRDCQYVTIAESDRVNGGNLAAYLGGLVGTTPNTGNRLEVLSSPLMIEVNGTTRELLPVEPQRVRNLTHFFRGCQDNTPEHFQGAFLLGYSDDETWSVESLFEPCGMTGFVAASAFLHNLRSLRTVQFEILRWDDFQYNYVESNPFPSSDVQARLNTAAEAAERIGFFKPQVLYSAPPRVSVDHFEGPPINLVFGTQRFEICISAEGGSLCY